MVSRWMKIIICVTSLATFKDDHNVSSLRLLIISGDNWQVTGQTNKPLTDVCLFAHLFILLTVAQSCSPSTNILFAIGLYIQGEELLIK